MNKTEATKQLFEDALERERVLIVRLEREKARADYWERKAEEAAQAPASVEAVEIGQIDSINPMTCVVTVRYQPDPNGEIPASVDRIGAKVYTTPHASAVPEGWKLVPCHATPEMLSLGKKATREEFLFLEDPDSSTQGVWKAMISVAPEALKTTTAVPEWVPKTLGRLADSIRGDCYMGEEWELRTIDSILSSLRPQPPHGEG